MLCDVGLPDGSGLDLVEEAIARDDHMAALVVSGLDEVSLGDRAVTIGAYGYIVKPFSANDVLIGVLGALAHRRREVTAREAIREASAETIQRLCVAVEARDAGTAAHVMGMSEHCHAIARELGLPPERCELLRAASPMHDVGKVGVPDHVLLKPGTLTAEERELMERHAEIGYRILAGSRAELLQLAATIAWTHHERMDGTGYPRGLRGTEIPQEGRIAAVADVFDALTRDRVYRRRFTRRQAMDTLEEGRGTHFDPDVLDAFAASFEQADWTRRAGVTDDRGAAQRTQRSSASPTTRRSCAVSVVGQAMEGPCRVRSVRTREWKLATQAVFTARQRNETVARPSLLRTWLARCGSASLASEAAPLSMSSPRVAVTRRPRRVDRQESPRCGTRCVPRRTRSTRLRRSVSCRNSRPVISVSGSWARRGDIVDRRSRS